jgi:two-component system, NarL family, response regulator DevR
MAASPPTVSEEGLRYRQIAAKMFLAEETIKDYVSRILAKLDLQRRTQVAVMATRLERFRLSR